MSIQRALIIFCTIKLILCFVVVAWGAYTRLVDAGLGCPDWPGCYGFLKVPTATEDIEKANLAFPDTPVDIEKGWPEMIHRYFASTLGLMCVIFSFICLCSKIRKSVDLTTKILSLFLLCWVMLQGAFGMWTVTLKLWPQVVTLHLLGGFITFCLILSAIARLRIVKDNLEMEPKNIIYYQSVFEKHQKNCRQLYMAGLVFCFLVFCQITLGGWVSSNYSALACPDFPTCQNQWLPDMDVASGFNIFQEIGPNYLGGVLDNPSRVAIHFTHRLGALIILISFILLYFLFVRIRSGDALLEPIKNRVKLIGIILLIQISLGLANIKFLIPLPVAIFHNLCGLLLLSVSLIFVWKVLEIRSRSKQFYYQDSAELNHQAALHESGVAL